MSPNKPRRNPTRAVQVGSIQIGGGAPIAVQSMAATKTQNVDATVRQVELIQAAGADLVRIAVEGRDLARAPLGPDELARFDTVVFDPPRAGAAAQMEELARSNVPVIAAVSCNPATFARDARTLLNGGYRLESVTPLDQFLWSPHIELVGIFRRG